MINLSSLFYNNFQITSIGFKDPASSLMENIFLLHNSIIIFIVIISGIVFWLLLQIIDNYITFFSFSLKKFNNSYLTLDKFYIYIYASLIAKKRLFKKDTLLEAVWTLLPGIILIIISIPSFYMLYLSEESIGSILTVKAIGFQWYWSFDYGDIYPLWYDIKINLIKVNLDDFFFDVYMEPIEYLNLNEGQYRLLETDNFVILPTQMHIRLIITSMDTLHSFAIPALGVKLDAIPGRLNKIELLIFRVGLYYGQCSEICGIGHSLMPISIYAVAYINFLIGEL